MAFIRSLNGNVVEFDDPNLGRRALADGHEVFESDPRKGPKKPKAWTDPDADGDDAGSDSE